MTVATLGSIIEEYLIEIGVTESADSDLADATPDLELALRDTGAELQ